MWHTVNALVPYLSQEIQDTQSVLQQAVFGTVEKIEKWKNCLSDANDHFGFALGSMFVNKVFQGHSKIFVSKFDLLF